MPNNVALHYPGGKGGVGVYQTIINSIPTHEVYIEAFLGGGSILLHKRPAKKNIGIDVDERVVRAWSQSPIPSLEVIKGNAIDILNKWNWQNDDPRQTLVYCDPPYLRETRSSARRIYRYDFSSVAEHIRLIQTLIGLPCMVMLSGYWSPLYDRMIGHWRHLVFRSKNRAGATTLEYVWMNFPPPASLHDYRYLGSGFRERERIKRKSERWRAKLLKMSKLERHAILAAVSDLAE